MLLVAGMLFVGLLAVVGFAVAASGRARRRDTPTGQPADPDR